MENIHTDPQEAYRKRQFAAQARKTLSTIDIGKAEQSESPEGVVGIRIVKDPVRSFLKERGFHGDPKIDYSVVIKTENIDNVETVHFTAFNDLKNFLTGNADRIVSKPDQIAYEIDYDPSVYEWSEGLPHEESQSLIEAWDKLGRDIMMDADKKAEDPPATDKEASKEKTQKKLEETHQKKSSGRLQHLPAFFWLFFFFWFVPVRFFSHMFSDLLKKNREVDPNRKEPSRPKNQEEPPFLAGTGNRTGS